MKFKEEDIVVIKNQPKQGFIAIEKIFTWRYHPEYKLYDGNYYFEDELISRKEYEYNLEFEKVING